MRRLITMLSVAAFTATATLYWLHDGDLVEAIEPVVADWDTLRSYVPNEIEQVADDEVAR